MKANEAPEKIYITNYDIAALPKDEQLSERWHEVSTQDTDIEYTCTDAFIEKAVKWLENNAINYWGTDAVDNGKMMLDFKKAMRV